MATAADVRVWHQTASLSFVYVGVLQPKWRCQGRTVLYVVNEASPPDSCLPIHLRGSCRILNVKGEILVGKKTEDSPGESKEVLEEASVSYQHFDPLAHVLVKPAQSYVEAGLENGRCDADTQCSRGAYGMTTGLRVASVASSMGELRLLVENCEHLAVTKDGAKACWKKDLENSFDSEGEAVERLRRRLRSRHAERSDDRLSLVADRLADASCIAEDGKKDAVQHPNRAFKLTIDFEVDLEDSLSNDMGGIHFRSYPTPHVYTTCGVLGDHEGPRCWIPCLDSASSKHRTSREFVIKVSASMRDGLRPVGCGEDFGEEETLLHDDCIEGETVDEIGQRHLDLFACCREIANDVDTVGRASSTVHLVPPDKPTTSLSSIFATSMWSSVMWSPIPSRSMGFVIAPLRQVVDPEYSRKFEEDMSLGENKPDDTSDSPEEAERNGEGIRQMYFAPLHERKNVHAKASKSLLKDTSIFLQPTTAAEAKVSEGFDDLITRNTAGVTNRALSLMRDVLALPVYRTASYTQIWIPDALHGGSTSGALHCCSEVLVNPFLGGAILDSRILPPPGFRLPYYNGGRLLQFIQARCAVRGWITAALPLGGDDDVGFGYIHTLFESFIMSLYERAHGANGEGGGSDSVFFTKRYAINSGLNSKNLDFLPVPNIEEEELDVVVGGVVGAVPIEDRNNDQLWRSLSNGTESHTSATDEFSCRQMLFKDIVEFLERGTDRDRTVPLPGFGWLGSYLSLSFLSSNSSSSSDLGCGSLELLHPVGGHVYRTAKCEVLRRVVEGRAGIANFIRLIRAAFVAAHIEDTGEVSFKMPASKGKNPKENKETSYSDEGEPQDSLSTFGLCVDEILSKHGLTHTLFTLALRKLAGHREPHLRGALVDVERENAGDRQLVEPQGFPNSFVRGSSELYLRVGAHVEPFGAGDSSQSSSTVKRYQVHVIAEQIIPDGGIAFGGPVTLRVVENEGQNHFLVRTLKSDGSRCDWGPISLHTAKPVTTVRQLTAASGSIEGGSGSGKHSASGVSSANQKRLGDGVFMDSILHGGGYQAIELIRLTNRTPLLWIRVDPQGLYGGRISVFQPDACLAEQLFHDGDAGAQIDAIRSLAERPVRIQGSVKVTTVYDVNVAELPVRVLGDCLRGSPALHCSLPHTPVVRAQCALGIAHWQNNKAPASANARAPDSWIGLNILLQYFNERFCSDGIILPVKFSRLALKKSEAEARQSGPIGEGGATNNPSDGILYEYVDSLGEGKEKSEMMKGAEELEFEEDEEYRVRSAVLTAASSIRARDGLTPTRVLRFLEDILLRGRESLSAANLVSPDEELATLQKRRAIIESSDNDSAPVDLSRDDIKPAGHPYVPSMLAADALLALCHVNARPAIIVDPATGKPVQSTAKHPVRPLIEASKQWLDWELYRERIRMEEERTHMTGIGGACHAPIASSAITALFTLAILQQSTTRPPEQHIGEESNDTHAGSKRSLNQTRVSEVAATSQFYIRIFDEKPRRTDVTLAACAQAVACICCASDRINDESREPLGLLTVLEFLLQRILEKDASPSLRQTLALLMIDSCTGKVCSMQRVGAIGGRGELCTAGARFLTGPLGTSHGGDNGSATLTTVSDSFNPAATSVNDGARRGLRLLTRAGHPHDNSSKDQVVVRVAKFATKLWRTINGESVNSSDNSVNPDVSTGICSHDGILRCSLLALWQWIWPKGCFAVLRVQSWRSLEGTKRYLDLGANEVMKITELERKLASAEGESCSGFEKIVHAELDRHRWRGEMARIAWNSYKAQKKKPVIGDGTTSSDHAIGQPLPPIERDTAFKQGGWIAAAAQQRRSMTLDGGTAVTKIRLTMKNSSSGGGN